MRLIDADAYQFPGDLVNEPTIDAVPVVHGRWVIKYLFNFCSECSFPFGIYEKYNYCPNCGAKMDGDGKI